MTAQFTAQSAPVESRAGIVLFLNTFLLARLHVGMAEDSLEAGGIFNFAEGGAFFCGIERHLEGDIFEHSMDANAQTNQRLVLFFGEVPHADGPAIVASAEVPAGAVPSGRVGLKFWIPQSTLVLLRQVQPPALGCFPV